MLRVEFHKKRWIGFGIKLCYENAKQLWSWILSVEFLKYELYMNYTKYK